MEGIAMSLSRFQGTSQVQRADGFVHSFGLGDGSSVMARLMHTSGLQTCSNTCWEVCDGEVHIKKHSFTRS